MKKINNLYILVGNKEDCKLRTLEIIENKYNEKLIYEENENFKIYQEKIKVEDTKKLINYLNTTTLYSNYKIFIIENSDYLNEINSNKLLKTFEDLNSKNIGFIFSENESNILPTILSRFIVEKVSNIEKVEIKIFEEYKNMLKYNQDKYIYINKIKSDLSINNIQYILDEMLEFYKSDYKKIEVILNIKKKVKNNVNVELLFTTLVIQLLEE